MIASGGSSPNHVPAGWIGGSLGKGLAGDGAAGAVGDPGADVDTGGALVAGDSLGVGDGATEALGIGDPVVTSTWVKCDQRYSRVVNPDSWISFASSRPK